LGEEEMITKIVAILGVAFCISFVPACKQNQILPSPASSVQPKIDSPESALQVAEAHLSEQKTNTTRHDMSKPENIQEITVQDQRAWRVSWRLKKFTGKGGQLVVIVNESGACEQGWGE
jgi:hypothetical protein